MQLMWPFQWVLQGLVVLQGKAGKAEYTLVVGYFGVGQWTFGALSLLPSHYFPHSTREGFLFLFSMAHILHIIVGHPAVPQDLLLVLPSIPPEVEAAVKLLHLK